MGLEQFSFLARDLPGFRHRGDKVRIIYEPKDFYKVRKTRYTVLYSSLGIVVESRLSCSKVCHEFACGLP
jgi:hypothetical protein